MRPQNAMLLIVAILGTMAGPANAQMMPAKPDVIRQQLGQAQAAQSGQAKPAAPKPAAQPQPAPVSVQSGPPAPSTDKPAASAKPVAAPKPTAQASSSAKAIGSAKAPAQASAKPGNPGAKPASADAAQAKLTPAVDKKAAAAAAPAAGKPASATAPAPVKVADAGGPKRDPFSPLVGNVKESNGSGGPDHLPPGKAGLMVGTMRLDGLVRGPNGMIAVVSNPQERVYFLREGDRIFDGQVTKITLEAVSFLQSGRDSFGNGLEHEVTRRLYATPGEQR